METGSERGQTVIEIILLLLILVITFLVQARHLSRAYDKRIQTDSLTRVKR